MRSKWIRARVVAARREMSDRICAPEGAMLEIKEAGSVLNEIERPSTRHCCSGWSGK